VITEAEDEDEPPSEAELLQQSGLYVEGDSMSLSSQVPSGWESNCTSSTKQRSCTVSSGEDSNAGRFYIPCDDDDDDDGDSTGSGDDEGFHLEETVGSTQWIDLPGVSSFPRRVCYTLDTSVSCFCKLQRVETIVKLVI
jgi:hypothetical protein